MRILYIITKFESFDLFLSECAVALSGMGNEVHVICDHKDNPRNLGKFDYDTHNIRFHYIDFARGFKIFSLYNTSKVIHQKVKQLNPDKISIHFTSGIFPAILTGKLPYHTTGTFHGLNHPIEKVAAARAVYKAVEYFCAYRLDRIITINHVDFRALSGLFAGKTTLLPTKGLGCDLLRFNPVNFSNEVKNDFKARLGIRGNDFVLSFIGRFVAFKGYDFVIRTFRKLKESDPHSSYRLLLMGEKDIHGTGLTEEEQNWLEHETSVIKAGFVADVENYLAITDCFFFPSVKEGVPISVTEALSMLVPTISVNARGNNDLIVDGFNGILLQGNQDPDKAIEAILKIKNDDTFRTELTKNMEETRSTLSRDHFINYELNQYK